MGRRMTTLSRKRLRPPWFMAMMMNNRLGILLLMTFLVFGFLPYIVNCHSIHENDSWSEMTIDENDTLVVLKKNLSLEELMAMELDENPLRDPLSIAIPMTIIYSLILISGLMGNFSTCVVIARTSYMHTATNYYLFSLAMSDLLLLISGLPQEIYHIWIKYPYIFGEAFCVIRGLAAETSANATVLTITAFTVERFVAIVYPLKSHKLSQLSRVVRMIVIIWLVAFCLALPQAAQFGVKDHMSRHDPSVVLIEGAWCTLVREIFPYAFQISICVFFAIPMTIITVLYVLIGLKLRRSRKGPLNHRGSQDLNVEPRTQNRHSQSHVVRMLVAVVVAFFICWAPFHAQRLMALYGGSQKVPSDLFMMFYQGLTHVSGILYYLSTCVNPILYHIMSNKFRQAFKDTMGHPCGRPQSRGAFHSRTYSAMSHRSSRMTHYTSQRGTTGIGITTTAASIRNHNQSRYQHQHKKELLSKVSEHSSEKSHEMIDFSPLVIPNGDGKICRCKCKTTTTLVKNNFITTTTNGAEFPCDLCGGGKGKGDIFKGYGDDGSNDTSVTPLNSSPNEKDTMIPMTSINNSTSQNHRFAHIDPPNQKKQISGLRSFLRKQKKNDKTLLKVKIGRCDSPTGGFGAITFLDSKGKCKSILRKRERMGSHDNGVAISGGGLHKTGCRAASNTSMNSNNTNTISNSSLQDLDDKEFTSEELAGYMAELNLNIESPK